MNVKAIITLKLTYAKMTIVFPKKGRNLSFLIKMCRELTNAK